MTTYVPKMRTLTKDGSLVDTPAYSDRSLVGVFMCVLYACVFLYIYATAVKNIELAPETINGKKNPFKQPINTLSDAIARSDRFWTTVLLMTFVGMFTGLMIEKEFLTTEQLDHKASTVIASFVLVAGILLLFIWPTDHDMDRIGVNDVAHFAIAFVIICVVAYNCFILSFVYNEMYEPTDTILALQGLGYFSIACVVAMVLIMAWDYMFKKVNKIWIGFFEVLIILVYWISLIIATSMPKLPDTRQAICVDMEVSQ